MTEKEKEQYDFYNLYIELQAKIGQETASYDDGRALYNHYSREFDMTKAMDIIDKLYEQVREAGLLKEEEEAEETTEEATVEEIKEEETETIEEVEVPYKDYKDYCAGKRMKKVPDSYDSRTKTIGVYMTQDQKEEYETWKEAEEAKWQVVEMPYKDWKTRYSRYQKSDYDNRRGTVKVTLPSTVQYERTADAHYEERHEFYAGYVDEMEILPESIDADDIIVEIPDELKNQEEKEMKEYTVQYTKHIPYYDWDADKEDEQLVKYQWVRVWAETEYDAKAQVLNNMHWNHGAYITVDSIEDAAVRDIDGMRVNANKERSWTWSEPTPAIV